MSLWRSEAPWAAPTIAVVRRYLGERRRAGRGHYAEPTERHEVACGRSAFSQVEVEVFEVERHWSIDQFVGALYSTSYGSPHLLGDRRAAFEADLRAALADAVPDGVVVNRGAVDVILARRPS